MVTAPRNKSTRSQSFSVPIIVTPEWLQHLLFVVTDAGWRLDHITLKTVQGDSFSHDTLEELLAVQPYVWRTVRQMTIRVEAQAEITSGYIYCNTASFPTTSLWFSLEGDQRAVLILESKLGDFIRGSKEWYGFLSRSLLWSIIGWPVSWICAATAIALLLGHSHPIATVTLAVCGLVCAIVGMFMTFWGRQRLFPFVIFAVGVRTTSPERLARRRKRIGIALLWLLTTILTALIARWLK